MQRSSTVQRSIEAVKCRPRYRRSVDALSLVLPQHKTITPNSPAVAERILQASMRRSPPEYSTVQHTRATSRGRSQRVRPAGPAMARGAADEVSRRVHGALSPRGSRRARDPGYPGKRGSCEAPRRVGSSGGRCSPAWCSPPCR